MTLGDLLRALGVAAAVAFLGVIGCFALVAYVAPLFGLDPNACTVVVTQ